MSCYRNRQRANGEAYGSKESSVPILQGNELRHNPTGKDMKKNEAIEAV